MKVVVDCGNGTVTDNRTGLVWLADADCLAEAVSWQEAMELADSLRNRIRFHNATNFVLDLKRVQFMDSGCLGALVSLLQELEHVRGRIALAGCQENVRFLMNTTRLDEAFPLYDEVRHAVADLRGE